MTKEKRTELYQMRVTPSWKRLSKKHKEKVSTEIINHLTKKFKQWEQEAE